MMTRPAVYFPRICFYAIGSLHFREKQIESIYMVYYSEVSFFFFDRWSSKLSLNKELWKIKMMRLKGTHLVPDE